MMFFLSTRQVAQLLGLNVNGLARAVWTGRIRAPEKGPSGNYLWTKSDIEHASWILRGRSIDDILGPKPAGSAI